MAHAQLLIVHSNPSALSMLTSMLRSLGHPIEEADSDRVALRRIERGGVDVLLAGVDPADPDSLELLSYVRRKHPSLPVLVLLAAAHSEREREATRLGAAAILRYPLPAGELRAAVLQAIESRGIDSTPKTPPVASMPSPIAPHAAPSTPTPANGPHLGHGHAGHLASRTSSSHLLHGESGTASTEFGRNPRIDATIGLPSAAPRPISSPVSPYTVPIDDGRNEIASSGGSAGNRLVLVGNAPAVRQAVEMASMLAPTMTPALIVGDQGTGKSLLARMIHHGSTRSEAPFVEVVCDDLDEAILERELFGQRIRGPEASIDRPGKILRAKGGTLFLDEVAALSPGLQLQLLRLLQDGEYEPQGSRDVEKADVRVILATQENLPLLVEQNKFRRDLYDQISIVCLKLPPLRERGLDIERLADFFRDRFAAEFGKQIQGFAPDALEAIARHEWNGNVRELESVIQRGVALCHGQNITAANLSLGYHNHGRMTGRPAVPNRLGHLPFRIRPLKEALEEPEKQIIIQALQALNWNRQETARMLDINRTTLYKKMKKYGLLFDEQEIMN